MPSQRETLRPIPSPQNLTRLFTSIFLLARFPRLCDDEEAEAPPGTTTDWQETGDVVAVMDQVIALLRQRGRVASPLEGHSLSIDASALRKCFSAGVTIATKYDSRRRLWAGA